MNASLIFREKKEIRHILLFPDNVIKFGRDDSNDIQLTLFPPQQLNDIKLTLFPPQNAFFQLLNADISRQHFKISRKENQYFIQDLGSTNGTSLDCVAVMKKEQQIHNNQIIDVGGVLNLKADFKENCLMLHRLNNTFQESYLLFSNVIKLGSDPQNSIVLSHSCIAPYHIQILYDGKQYSLRKVIPTSHILMNGTPMLNTTQPLENETYVLLEEFSFLFKIHSDKGDEKNAN